MQVQHLLLPLHLRHKPAVVGLHQGVLDIEGTADSRVSDNRGEDVGAVDQLALLCALVEHVGLVRVVAFGEAREHCMPEKSEQVWVDPRESLL